jgi:hypothetical protein
MEEQHGKEVSDKAEWRRPAHEEVNEEEGEDSIPSDEVRYFPVRRGGDRLR